MASLLASQPAHAAKAAEFRTPPPGQPYSVGLPGSEKPGRSKVYRHWKAQDGLLETLDPNIRTAHEMFEQAATRMPNNKCLGFRPYQPATKTFGPYQWLTYSEVQRRRAAFGVGLVELHKRACVTEDKYGVGLWCQNRPEWQITDLACMSQSLYTVSLYDTLGPSASEYVINHAGLCCVVVSLPHIATLLKLKPRLPSLKIIISLDPLDEGEMAGYSKKALLSDLAQDLGVSIYSIDEVEALGQSLNRPYTPPKGSDIITINYTSGTTGAPKGVVLTHVAAVASASTSLCTVNQLPTDVSCSYLPLAHIYGRMLEGAALWVGMRMGYFHGNILELVDDLKLLRPTAFSSVPRLFNRFGGAIKAATIEQSGFKGALSRHVVSTKMANLKNPDPRKATAKHAIYDRIWGKKVAAALGLDRARTMLSGSAPLDPSLHQFLRIVFANQFAQGFGMTETYANGICQVENDFSAGNCGGLVPAMECCLASVPEMEYSVDDKPHPRGELLMRGYCLFKGYHKNPEETAKSMTEDGWFRTGDIATIDPMGRVTIIDRRKNVLKLAQGEYISPERVEGVYLSGCNYLAQAYVHGDSLQTFLVALFGVQPDMFAPFASKILGKPIEMTDMKAIAEAAADERVRKAVLKDLDRIGRKNNFAGYERVKNAYLYVEPFSIENDLLTPTLKLKRPPTAKKFRRELDALYAEALEWEKSQGPKAKL